MKVLVTAKHIYDANNEKLVGFTSGLGTMMQSLLNEIGKNEEVFFFPTDAFLLKDYTTENYTILHNYSLCAIRKIPIVLKMYKKENNSKELISLKGIRQTVYLSTFLATLNKIRPDIVHINSFNKFSFYLIKICEEKKIPFILTGHNYFGKNSQALGYEEMKEYGQKILERDNIFISLMSSGAKRKVMEDYPDIGTDKIRLIYNGTNKKVFPTKVNIREKLNIQNKKKILLCVGNLIERKNQLQIVRAYAMLKKEYQDDIVVIFCGKDKMDGKLQQLIEKCKLKKNLLCVGAVPVQDMNDYYLQADGVISASLMEGFPMVFAEAFVYGVPIIFPCGLDIEEDLSDENIGYKVNDSSDEAFKEAIEKWYYRKWDKEYIKEFSERFKLEDIAQQYVKYYKEILEVH